MDWPLSENFAAFSTDTTAVVFTDTTAVASTDFRTDDLCEFRGEGRLLREGVLLIEGEFKALDFADIRDVGDEVGELCCGSAGTIMWEWRLIGAGEVALLEF